MIDIISDELPRLTAEEIIDKEINGEDPLITKAIDREMKAIEKKENEINKKKKAKKEKKEKKEESEKEKEKRIQDTRNKKEKDMEHKVRLQIQIEAYIRDEDFGPILEKRNITLETLYKIKKVDELEEKLRFIQITVDTSNTGQYVDNMFFMLTRNFENMIHRMLHKRGVSINGFTKLLQKDKEFMLVYKQLKIKYLSGLNIAPEIKMFLIMIQKAATVYQINKTMVPIPNRDNEQPPADETADTADNKTADTADDQPTVPTNPDITWS
jgi:hypothetical protein